MSHYIADSNETSTPLQDPDVNTDAAANSCLDLFEERNSEASIDTCCSDDLSKPFSVRVTNSKSYNSPYRLAPNSNAVFNSDNTLFGQELPKAFLPHSPYLTVPTMPYSDISADGTILQKDASVKIKESTIRGFDDGNDSDNDISEDDIGGHGNLVASILNTP